jgi:copper chaperone NosL
MRLFAIPCIVALLVLGGCKSERDAPMPTAFSLTEEAIGRYCGMNVLEHDGPKGQVILSGMLEPIWFSSARDTIAFTLLPEEPKNIAAIYVSDMATAASWEKPGADNWIDARKAFFVLGSSRRGGMGVDEAVPFSTEAAAVDFVAKHGGRIVRFADISLDHIRDGSGKDASSDHGAHESGARENGTVGKSER